MRGILAALAGAAMAVACEEAPDGRPDRYPRPEANSAWDIKVKPEYKPFRDTATLTVWSWQDEKDIPKAEGYVRSYRLKPKEKEPGEREVHTLYTLDGHPLAVLDEKGKYWRIDERGEMQLAGQLSFDEVARRVLRIPRDRGIEIVDYDDKPKVVKDQEEAAKRAKVHVLKGKAPAPAP